MARQVLVPQAKEESEEAPCEEDRPMAVEVKEAMLWVTLKDGRVIGTPLKWYPILTEAIQDELTHVELLPDGIRWPDLDEDLSIRGMLKGNRPPRWRRGEWQKRLAEIKKKHLSSDQAAR